MVFDLKQGICLETFKLPGEVHAVLILDEANLLCQCECSFVILNLQTKTSEQAPISRTYLDAIVGNHGTQWFAIKSVICGANTNIYEWKNNQIMFRHAKDAHV